MLSSEHSNFLSVLSKVSNKSCPNNINLHCHTLHSDGSLQALELYNQANSIGLEHLAITDHHSIRAYYELKQLFSSRSYRPSQLKLWHGIEITCLLKGCLVHILGFDFDLNSESMKPYIQGESVKGSQLRAESVIKAIHQAHGITSLAHPARYRLHFKELIVEASSIGIDAIEVWYDYNFSKTWTASDFVCLEIDKLVRKLGLYSTCGTDTHGLSLLSR